MWELGEKTGSYLIFAEHRYFGESVPEASSTPPSCLRYLTTEQATADYATLISSLRKKWNDVDNEIKFIGFGGSYGGMLGSWMRMRYPDALDGMIAGSAPILSFQGLNPPYDPNTYDKLVTRDAGGLDSWCVKNLKSAWKEITEYSSSVSGRELLSRSFKTCVPLDSEAEALELISWVQAPMGYMAMGDYPFASDYMTHGDGKPMVAYPFKVACSHLSTPSMKGSALLRGVAGFASVYYNRTNVNAKCLFNGDSTSSRRRRTKPMTRAERDGAPSNGCAGTWDYMYCTEMVQPFASGTGQDLFYPASPWNVTQVAAGCLASWGVTTRPDWATIGFPGSRLDNGRFSNIVFTNGALDPWSGGGVTRNISHADDLVAFVLKNGAHHLDFMWSHPNDPPDAIAARAFISSYIHKWTVLN